MKACGHSYWLGLATQGDGVTLRESDRLRTLTDYIQYPDLQKPSLFVLIGHGAKSVALRESFGVKRTQRFRNRETAGGIHLHLDSSTISTGSGRPVLLADADFTCHPSKAMVTSTTQDKCHDTTSHDINWAASMPLGDIATKVYTRLLFPFADVFCFFSSDLGGFRQVAVYVAAWLQEGSSSSLPKSTHPTIIIVSDKIPVGTASEKEAKKAFLWILSEETTKNPLEQFADIDVVALHPAGTISSQARYRSLKERLMNASDQIRARRENARYLFSATHFRTLVNYACAHFTKTIDQPFKFIEASRTYNPVASDLHDHISTLLRCVRTHVGLTEFAVPVIASSFLLDNYPPEAHSKSLFPPLPVSY